MTLIAKSGVPANETWRRDPARQAAWRNRIEETQAAYAEAHEHLKRAQAVLNGLGRVTHDEDALVARGIEAVERAVLQFERDTSLVMREPNDTALGNKAAFGTPPGWDAGAGAFPAGER